jgi:hypothetical protein
MALPDGSSDAQLLALGFSMHGNMAQRGQVFRYKCDRCGLWWRQLSKLGKEAQGMCQKCRPQRDGRARP